MGSARCGLLSTVRTCLLFSSSHHGWEGSAASDMFTLDIETTFCTLTASQYSTINVGGDVTGSFALICRTLNPTSSNACHIHQSTHGSYEDGYTQSFLCVPITFLLLCALQCRLSTQLWLGLEEGRVLSVHGFENAHMERGRVR